MDEDQASLERVDDLGVVLVMRRRRCVHRDVESENLRVERLRPLDVSDRQA